MSSKTTKSRSRRAPAKKTAQPAQPAKPDGYKFLRGCSQAEWTLFSQAEHTERLLRSTLGPHHPLTLGLADEMHVTASDGQTVINADALRRELARVFERSPGEVRHVFRGWEPQREWWTKNDLIDDVKDGAAHPGPFLEVALCDGLDTPAQVYAGIGWEPSDSRDEVRILIQEGTPKATAIRLLLRLVTFIENAWDHGLTTEPEITSRVANMSLDYLKAGGKKGGGR